MTTCAPFLSSTLPETNAGSGYSRRRIDSSCTPGTTANVAQRQVVERPVEIEELRAKLDEALARVRVWTTNAGNT